MLLSIVLVILPQVSTYLALMAFCVCLGLFGGSMDGIFSALLVEMFGLDLYSSAFGYSNIFIHAIGMGTTVLMGKY